MVSANQRVHCVLNRYNNTYHSTIKIKFADVKASTYTDFNKENNKTDPKLVGNHVKISKYKNIFKKGYTPNQSEEVFVIKKVKNIVPWTYIINTFNGEEIVATLQEKYCKNQIKKSLELKK